MKMTNVVPMTALVLVVGGLLTMVWPAARAEVLASVTRAPSPYVTLAFADPRAEQQCEQQGGRRSVTVTIHNELGHAANMVADFTVNSAGQQYSAASTRVFAADGSSIDVTMPVQVPQRRDYDLLVALADRSERLLQHCGTGSR